MASSSQLSNQTPTKYSIRWAGQDIIVNNQPISYGNQILDIDKLYIISSNPESNLKLPIILNRNQQIDQLDRKIFIKKFTFQIAKGLQICSLDDAVFIIKRVPLNFKYIIPIVQKLTLLRWKQLIAHDQFFAFFYAVLQKIISKRQITKLRTDYIEDLLKTKLKETHARLFFLLDNLALQDQSLRNTLIGLTRQLAIREMDTKYFFQKQILNNIKSQMESQQDQNLSNQDNKSQTDSIPEDKELKFPQMFLFNAINIIKSCLKLKISNQFISCKILNKRFFKILKKFFQQFFQKQKILLIQMIAIASELQPSMMWKITFDEGKNVRQKTLSCLEALITNNAYKYSQSLRKVNKGKRSQTPQNITRQKKQSQNAQSPLAYEQFWQYTSIIIEKFISFQSAQKKGFLTKILDSLLSFKLVHEELQFILILLQKSLKDIVSEKKNIQIWQMITTKIQQLINKIRFSGKNNKQQIRGNKTRKCTNNQSKRLNNQSIGNQSMIEIVCEQDEGNKEFKYQRKQNIHVKLPINKRSIISLMKIYKLLIMNENRYNLNVDQDCLNFLLQIIQNRKGLVQSVKLSLIQAIGKERSSENFEEPIGEER